MLRLFLSAVCLCSAMTSFAAVCDAEICTETVERVAPTYGDLWIKLAGGVSTTSCPTTNGILILKSQSNESYKDLYSLFLMAYTTEEKVRVRIATDSDGKCEIKYAYVDKTFN